MGLAGVEKMASHALEEEQEKQHNGRLDSIPLRPCRRHPSIHNQITMNSITKYGRKIIVAISKLVCVAPHLLTTRQGTGLGVPVGSRRAESRN